MKLQMFSGSYPQVDTQTTAAEANPAADMGAAAADTDIGAHRWLDRFTIGTAGRQRKSGRNQNEPLEVSVITPAPSTA